MRWKWDRSSSCHFPLDRVIRSLFVLRMRALTRAIASKRSGSLPTWSSCLYLNQCCELPSQHQTSARGVHTARAQLQCVCVCGTVHVLDGSVRARSYFKVPWTTKWEHSFVTTWRGCVVCVRVCVCARSVTHGTCALSLWGRKKITQYIWHCMFPIIKWN